VLVRVDQVSAEIAGLDTRSEGEAALSTARSLG
jgi:hypothetical protein